MSGLLSHSKSEKLSKKSFFSQYGEHLPPIYARDSWAYTGRHKGRLPKPFSRQDTQLWKPHFQENISSLILNCRRKEKLQDLLREPARMNLASLHKVKERTKWPSAYEL
mmetsp:Transcript_26306/g.47144  ORF Transcript_26306/g.47144 Transcript_26306/m.47144 type:complete len:109 (+) Transcript_26306:3-329(+)